MGIVFRNSLLRTGKLDTSEGIIIPGKGPLVFALGSQFLLGRFAASVLGWVPRPVVLVKQECIGGGGPDMIASIQCGHCSWVGFCLTSGPFCSVLPNWG